MNKERNHEDVLMSLVSRLWRSDYGNDFIAEVLADIAPRILSMECQE